MGRVVACLALIAAVAAWPGTPAAEDAADQAAIIAVIRAQLDAFQRDAADEAFAYASPSIQRAFRTPDAFMAMVRGGYRPAYRPRSVDFLDLVTTSGGLTQRVLFVGPDGAPVIAHYHMQRQPDGSWRIDGVTLYDSSQPV